MRILIASDLHIQNAGMFARPVEGGMTTRAQTGFAFLSWMADFTVDAILLCGDLFSTKQAVPTTIFNLTWDWFTRICSNTPVYAIPGNHDRYMQTPAEASDPTGDVSYLAPAHMHSLYALGRGVPGFYVLDGTNELLTDRLQVTGIPAGFPIPDELPPKEAPKRVLMIHENLLGASYPTGYKVVAGVGEKELLAWAARGEVDAIFCGDIHLAQWYDGGLWDPYEDVPIRGTKGRIFIPGAPYQMDFGDEGNRKGVLIWDTDRDEVEFVRWLGGPVYHTITDQNIHNFEYWDNAHYRFRVTKGKDTALKLAEKLKGKCIVEYVPEEKERLDFGESDLGSYRDLIPLWVEEKKADKSLVTLGMSLYDRALCDSSK